MRANFECRDAFVPVLRSLQHVYSKPSVTESIVQLIGRDINGKTSAKRGREGMDYVDIAIRSEMTQEVIRKAKNSTNDNMSNSWKI